MNASPLRRAWQWFVRTTVGRSIFRVGVPASNLERSQAMISSFFLHFQPAKVNRHALRPGYSLGLGLISLYLFAILVGTGVLLMFYYVPSTNQAYDVMKDLQFVVSAGLVVRNMHRWAAHLMVLFVMLHLCRVFYTGAYKRPREFNWLLGTGLFLVTLGLSFTGYLLPWDQLAFWAITVGIEHRRLRPDHRAEAAIPAARRPHRRAGRAHAVLRPSRHGAARRGGVDDLGPSLARAQGRRAVATGRKPATRCSSFRPECCRRTRPTG